MQRNLILPAIALITFAFPSELRANPIIVGPKGLEALGVIFVSLIIEAIVVSLLLRSFVRRRANVFLIWLFLTTVTFVIFSSFIILSEKYSNLGFPDNLIIGEVAVILIEGFLLKVLVAKVEGNEKALNLMRALIYSLIANAASVAVALAILWGWPAY